MTSLNKNVVAIGESVVLRVDVYVTAVERAVLGDAARLSIFERLRFSGELSGLSLSRTYSPTMNVEPAVDGRFVAHLSGRFVLRADRRGRHQVPGLALACGPVVASSRPASIFVYRAPPRLHDLARGIVPLEAELPTGVPGRVHRSTGTGFFVRYDALVTSFHAVYGARKVRVSLPDGRTIRTSKAWVLDPVRDVAILHVDQRKARDSGVRPLDLARQEVIGGGFSDGIPVAFTYGWPMGTQRSTVGVLHAEAVLRPGEPVWVSDNEVRRGDSGGPLLDPSGRVLGVVSAGAVSAGGRDVLREELCIATDPRPAMSILSVSGGPKKLRSIFKDERFRASPYVQAFEIQYRIAASLRSGESLQEMFDRLDRAAESRSRDPGLQFVRGMIYDSVGRREAALHSYERALEAYDGFFPASYVLGIEYLRRRDFKRALVQFEHTTGHRPYAHIGAYGLAKALMGLHRYDEAASWLRTVIDYDPSFAPAVFELARCHVAAGDLARAGQSVVRLRQLSARWARRLEALIENETLHPRAVRPLPRATVSLALPPPDGV